MKRLTKMEKDIYHWKFVFRGLEAVQDALNLVSNKTWGLWLELISRMGLTLSKFLGVGQWYAL